MRERWSEKGLRFSTGLTTRETSNGYMDIVRLLSIQPEFAKTALRRLVTAARNVDLDRLPSLDNPIRKIDQDHGQEL